MLALEPDGRRTGMRLLFSAVGGEAHLQPLLPLARAATSAVLEETWYRMAAARVQAEIAALPKVATVVRLLERLAVERRPLSRARDQLPMGLP